MKKSKSTSFSSSHSTDQSSQLLNAVHDSGALLNQIISSSPDCIKILDLEGRLLFMNENGQRLLELDDVGPQMNSVWADWFPGRPGQLAKKAVEDARLGSSVRFEAEAETFNGTKKFWDLSVAPIVGREGKVERLLSTARDITDRKTLESRRQESEEHFRAAFDQAVAGIVLADLNGRVIRANKAFCRMLGYEESEFIGLDSRNYTHPDDRANNSENVVKIKSGELKSIVYEKRYLRKTGETVWAQISLSAVLNSTGQPASLIGVAEDVTDRQAIREQLADKEERLRLILKNVKDHAIFTTDLQGVVTHWNSGAERIFGYSESEIIGTSSDVLWNPVDLKADVPACERHNAASDGEALDERWHQRKNQDLFFASGSMAPIRDESGELRGFVKICRDITASRAADIELQETKRRLDSALIAGEIGTFVWEVPEDKLYGDRNFEKLFAVTLDSNGAAPLSAFIEGIHPEDRGRVSELLKKSLETGCDYEAEYRIITGGQVRWVTARGKVERDSEGKVARFPGVLVDNTARILAEEAKKKSDERLAQQTRIFDTILSSTPDFAYIFDRDGRFLYANRGLLHVWGKTLEAIVGKTCYELGYPDWHADMHMREIRQVIDTRLPLTGEVPYTSPTNLFGYYEYIFNPVLGPDGKVEVIAGTTRDVTERKASERSLRELAEQRGLALEAAQLGWWSFDPETRNVVWDARVREIFDVSEETLSYDQIIARIHPDDRATVDNAVALSTNPEDPKPYIVEYRVPQRDGSVKWVASKARAYFETFEGIKRLYKFVGTTADITASRLAEDALRASENRFVFAVEAARLGTFHWPVRGNSIWNNKLKELFWIDNDPQLQDLSLLRGIHPDDRKNISEAYSAAFAEKGRYEFEYRIVGPERQIRWIRVIGQNSSGEDGRPARFDGVALDITQRKLVDQEREQLLASERAARGEAERINRMKDDFLATLSHELRTPLNAILGWSQILRRGRSGSETMSEGLEIIERNTRVQAQLIDDLLDMSKIISGKIRLDVRPVDLADLVKASIEAVRPAMLAKDIRLESLLSTSPQGVVGDGTRLQQVFWNLLSNASKFTPKGGVIRIALRQVASHVEISVQDNGKGVKAEFLPYVFERFRQADSSTTRQHGGLGLGLSIVKQLVELHGGTVRVESPGENLGSTFTVSLPLFAVRHANIEGSPAGHDGEMDLQEIRVLVVDDEPDARRLAQQVLESCNAHVETASSMEEALAKLNEFNPQVLLSDIGMPDHDGYELIRRIRALPQHGNIPAAALTALARPEDRTKAMLAGFQTHVSKPVDASELVAVVLSLSRLR